MLPLDAYRTEFVNYLSEKIQLKEPKNLYRPILYILQLGGKRLRPIMTLSATQLFDDNYQKAMDAALAIELFHNFSLIHDDIMDNAPLRRGQKTVHEKWNINTGILSGDAMLILAYSLFENYPAETFKELAELFSTTAIQVCEGQQYDIDFEERNTVSIEEYLKMIEYKTAVLLGAAMKMGAIIGGASEACQQNCYEFGKNLGIAFQLQDDYLDAFGNPKTFGKQIGGDIIENKKTFLYLKAVKKSSDNEARQLEHLYTISPLDPKQKIEAVKQIFEESGAAESTKNAIKMYTEKAFFALEKIQVDAQKTKLFKDFGASLMTRSA